MEAKRWGHDGGERERDCKGDTWKNAINEGGGGIGVMGTFGGG
jgi:hypothetical protein